MTDAPVLTIRKVTKLYGRNKAAAFKMLREGADKAAVREKTGVTVALHDVSFAVEHGEIFVIIGLSGSGKSTLLRCLNMLHEPTSGDIIFRGDNIAAFDEKRVREYRRKNISMVFQNFGLMSHRNVLRNVAYGLEVRGVSREERERRAREMLEMVGLGGWEQHAVGSLSGGMRQRVGLARALANDPDILLMDEPFSALDPLVRHDMQLELLSIQRNLGKTVVFITHDINEAFKLGDRVAIMRDGGIEQLDTPERMSAAPANEYVGAFINSADKTQVLRARQVMATPSCLVEIDTGVNRAIQEMRSNGVSSVYVVGPKMRLLGIVTIDDAIRARKESLPLRAILIRDVSAITGDALLSDVLPLAVASRFPVAVVDGEQRLRGLVTKAAVLSSLL